MAKRKAASARTNEKLDTIQKEGRKQTRLETSTRKEMIELKMQLKRMIRVHKYSLIEHPARLLSFQFLIGLVRGLGSFIGATIVVGFIIYLLSSLGYTEVLQDFNSLRSI
ncbi:hypothetical protein HOI83_01435 [Candidatus Uhrbacteria bacterium]|jgi:hypothetical protein|nr:hypothetical protein [Candidatus Uhrbacteria bacterium]HJN84925.1 DUF5665 domain-containing protein [Patescibacteria group bacterium]